MLGAELREEMQVNLQRLHELPPLAPEAQALLAILADEDSDLEDVARAIERVPALAARIIGLACSAYFGGKQARSVLDAIVRVLGLSLVRSLALGIVVGGHFDAHRCPAFSPEQYWSSALLTATLARSLAEAAVTEEPVMPDSAYLCGLVHNLGLLAMVHIAPGETACALERAAENPEQTLTEIENDLLGIHHCRIGAWLAMRWQLPPEIPVVMQHHHDATYRGPSWPVTLLVGVATRWGRQRLTGVEQPWVAPEWLDALGMDQRAFANRVAGCAAQIDDIIELGRVLAT